MFFKEQTIISILAYIFLLHFTVFLKVAGGNFCLYFTLFHSMYVFYKLNKASFIVFQSLFIGFLLLVGFVLLTLVPVFNLPEPNGFFHVGTERFTGQTQPEMNYFYHGGHYILVKLLFKFGILLKSIKEEIQNLILTI